MTRHPFSIPPAAEPPVPIHCDASRKFVRTIERRPDGLVAFEFSIGWPELSVELLLPQAAFADFCATHRVEMLPPRPEHPDPDPDTEETTE